MKVYSEEKLFKKIDEVNKYQWVEWALLALLQMNLVVWKLFGIEALVPWPATVILFVGFAWLVIMRNVKLQVLRLLLELE